MKITRSNLDTAKGPANWFAGDVYVDMIVGPEAPSRASAATCAFHARSSHALAHPSPWRDHPRH
jgi:hypothetical protein